MQVGNAMPYMSPSWLKCREVGRRKRRINDLELGWRYAAAVGDERSCREIEGKINEIKAHLREMA